MKYYIYAKRDEDNYMSFLCDSATLEENKIVCHGVHLLSETIETLTLDTNKFMSIKISGRDY